MNLGDLLAASARQHPDRVAVVWDDGRQRRTYRELNERTDALAAALVEELGVRPGDRVSVMKNGKLIGTERVEDVTEDDILSMIILGKNPRREAA